MCSPRRPVPSPQAGLPCFEPLEGLRVHALHTSLHLLQPIATTKMKRGAKRGSALGVVVEVALLNGVRTMSIRSAVSLLNGTEVRVEMLTTAALQATA